MKILQNNDEDAAGVAALDYAVAPLPKQEPISETPTGDEEEEDHEEQEEEDDERDKLVHQHLEEMRDELRLMRENRRTKIEQCNALLGTAFRFALLFCLFLATYHKIQLNSENVKRQLERFENAQEEDPLHISVQQALRNWSRVEDWMHTDRLRTDKPSPCSTTLGHEPTPPHVLCYYLAASLFCANGRTQSCARLSEPVYECTCIERVQCRDMCTVERGCTPDNCPCAHYRCVEYAPNTVVDSRSMLASFPLPNNTIASHSCTEVSCDVHTGQCRHVAIECKEEFDESSSI